MSNFILTLWLVCLTIFVIGQQIGDLGRWQRVGAHMRLTDDSIKHLSQASLSHSMLHGKMIEAIAIQAGIPDDVIKGIVKP